MPYLENGPPGSRIAYDRETHDSVGRSRLKLAQLALLVGLILFLGPFLIQQGLIQIGRSGPDEDTEEGHVRQFAIFAPTGLKATEQMLYPSDITQLRKNLKQQLEDQSGDLLDYYAGLSEISLQQGEVSVQAEATGIDGHFADLHTFNLLSGSFLNPDDWNRNLVVLDEVLAWQLFGATDVAGLTTTIGDQDFTVAGVIRLPDHVAAGMARSDQPQVFLFYDVLEKMDENLSVSAYEVRIAEAVPGLGLSLFKEALQGAGKNPEDLVVQNQDSRFTWTQMISSITRAGRRAMQNQAIALPWWENTARAAADLAGLLIWPMVLGLLVFLAGLREMAHSHPFRPVRLSLQVLTGSVLATALAVVLANHWQILVWHNFSYLAVMLAPVLLVWLAWLLTRPPVIAVWTRLKAIL